MYVNSRNADSTPDQLMFKSFHFVHKTIFDICYQELFSFACELILFVEKWIRFDKGSEEVEVYHVVLVREKSDVLSLLDEGVVSGRLQSFLLLVGSRGQQHLNMVLGAGGGLQADDEAVLEDKTEIWKPEWWSGQPASSQAYLGMTEAELCLITMNSR